MEELLSTIQGESKSDKYFKMLEEIDRKINLIEELDEPNPEDIEFLEDPEDELSELELELDLEPEDLINNDVSNECVEKFYNGIETGLRSDTKKIKIDDLNTIKNIVDGILDDPRYFRNVGTMLINAGVNTSEDAAKIIANAIISSGCIVPERLTTCIIIEKLSGMGQEWD